MTNDKRTTPIIGTCTFITAWTSSSWTGLQIRSSLTGVSLSPRRVADSGAGHPAPNGDRFKQRRSARQSSTEAARTRVVCCTGAVDVKDGVDGRGEESISISGNINIGEPANGKGESENSERGVRTEEEIERLFSRLTHVNKNMRIKASNSLAEMANDADIDRLLSLLTVEDVHHRRQAVQTLGMIGVRVVPKLINLITDCDGQSSTVRASCAKAMAAISLYYPEERAMFNEGALNGLRDTLSNDPDPVTRISVIGCLGSLGCDHQTRRDGSSDNCDSDNVVKGNEMAFEVLYEICSDRDRLCSDMAVSATAVSALAQIAQNGSAQRRDEVIGLLQSLTAKEEDTREDKEGQEEEGEWDDDDESGLQYVEEIAVGHLEQLMSKGQ